MKFFLEHILSFLARRTISKYQPLIVGVTGSVGKTSSREAIFTVLSRKYRARRSDKNYNTEIGVPLTILGIPHSGKKIFGWIASCFGALVRLVIRDSAYPDILVIEMGADHPGDIGYLARLAPPLVGVITAISDVPVHVKFFTGPKELALEKAKLIEALPPEGYAVLNADDEMVRTIRDRTRGHVFSFGFGEDADVRIRDFTMRVREGASGVPSAGIGFTIEHDGKSVHVELENTFGRQQATAAATAAAVGLVFNMNLAEIATALRTYASPSGRLKLLRGNKGSLILDDSYNSSPQASEAALEVLREFPARRRIAVLGDMLELGAYTESAHRMLGAEVARVADLCIGVGGRMKFALDEVSRPQSDNRRVRDATDILWYATPTEAGKKLDELLRSGDVVLIKGSQSMRMERAVKEVMAEPERADELLVRQTVDWLRRP